MVEHYRPKYLHHYICPLCNKVYYKEKYIVLHHMRCIQKQKDMLIKKDVIGKLCDDIFGQDFEI